VASYFGLNNCVKKLITSGANIDEPDNLNTTPLMAAASSGVHLFLFYFILFYLFHFHFHLIFI